MGKLVWLSVVVAAFAAFFGERIVNFRKRCLASREITNNHLPNCVLLKNLDHGSEDITILGNGLAFISTGLKYPGIPTSDVLGKIVVLDLNDDSQLKPVELRMPRNFDLESFNPHGISIYVDPKDDTIYLFVVSHPEHKSQVELFQFVEEDFSLVHLKTIKHELLYSVNDIVAVGVDSFYVTNDHYYANEFLKSVVEPILSQPWCNVVYYSPEEVKIVSEGYYFANGINISPDKKFIYVADLLDHNVHVLERKEDKSLVSVKSVATGTLVDNIEVDPETGDLWIGCHPNGWKLFVFDPNNPPGSEAIRIQDIHSDQPVVTQVFADDGHVIMGSSAAAPYGGKLLIGTVFHKAMRCDLKKRCLASREITNNHLPNCVLLKNLDHGSEDITILGNGLAFISTGLKYPGIPASDVLGKIVVLDLNDDSQLKPVEPRMPRNFDLESFNPLGMSLYVDPKDDTIYLFVVSHPEHKSQVELFQFVEEDFSLVHLKTIKHELLYSVNDIVAVGVDSFYVTNDHYYTSDFMKSVVELFLSQPWCNVVYYSPEEVKIVSEGYYFADGINISPDKKFIYVADLLDHNVHVLERKEDNSLVSVKSVATGTLVDNIEVDPETGDLWIGCHPNGWKLFVFDPNNPPGSEVIRIQDIHSDQPVVTQVFADDGHVIMGSSAAAPYGGKLLIGTVFHKAMRCDLK